MRICQICAVDFTLKTFIIPLIDAQLEKGHQVVAVCSEGKYTNDLREAGYEIKSISISRSFNFFYHLKSVYLLFKFLKNNPFDVVHVHTPIAAMIGRLAAFLSGTPIVVYTAHGFYFHENMNFLKKYLYIFLEVLFGSITDLLFTQSKEDAESAIRFKIAPKEKVYAIGNGSDVKKFNPEEMNQCYEIRKSLDIPKDAFLVGMISRLVKEKGVEDFLEAAKIITESNNNCYFILIGEHQIHDHAESVDEIIESAKDLMKEKLILTGYRSDIPELLSAMDLFTLPSWREGMPRSIIEAMMMSLPVLATDIRGSREEVVHNKTGILVPIKSPNKMAKAIQKFITNPSWSKQLGLAGRARALKLYDEKNVVKLQIDIIENQNLNKN